MHEPMATLCHRIGFCSFQKVEMKFPSRGQLFVFGIIWPASRFEVCLPLTECSILLRASYLALKYVCILDILKLLGLLFCCLLCNTSESRNFIVTAQNYKQILGPFLPPSTGHIFCSLKENFELPV